MGILLKGGGGNFSIPLGVKTCFIVVYDSLNEFEFRFLLSTVLLLQKILELDASMLENIKFASTPKTIRCASTTMTIRYASIKYKVLRVITIVVEGASDYHVKWKLKSPALNPVEFVPVTSLCTAANIVQD